MRCTLASVLTVGILALAACGGDDVSAGEQWAGEVCTAVATWEAEIEQLFADVQAEVTSGEEGAVDAIRAGIDDGAAATQALENTLKELGPPETDAGQAAQAELEATAEQVKGTIAEVQTTLESLGEADLTEVLAELASVAGNIQGVVGTVEDALTGLQSADDEIRAGFEDAEACKQLRGETGG